MSNVLKKIDNICIKIEKVLTWGGVIGGIGLFATVFIIFYAVLSRYVLNIALPWSVELGGYLLLFIVWIGVANSFRSGEIPRMLLIYRSLSPKTQAVLDICTWSITLIFLLLLLREEIKLIPHFINSGVVSVVMQIPRWWLAIIVTIGLASLCLQMGISIYLRWRRLGPLEDESTTENQGQQAANG
ncbi:MAG: TRAP transporter small permease [Deltaproteobacteria bacterium]|nr:TRAP transporter small permease [Deltaproteobacteria bacterium]